MFIFIIYCISSKGYFLKGYIKYIIYMFFCFILYIINIFFVLSENNLCNPDIDNYKYNPINCQLSSECRNQIRRLETTVSNPGAICCSGLSSCKNGSTNMSTVLGIHVDITQQIYRYQFKPVAIRCDAERSCDHVTNIKATNGGNIFLTAVYAGFGVESIATENEYDIFCTGRRSCLKNYVGGMKFFGANNLYCLGRFSCQYGIVTQDNNDIKVNYIWAYADSAFLYGTVEHLGSSVHCGGYQACYEATLARIGSTVHGEGYQVLYGCNLTNIGENVIVFGKEGAYESDITNVGQNLIAIGEMVLSFTTIKNVSKVCKLILCSLTVFHFQPRKV